LLNTLASRGFLSFGKPWKCKGSKSRQEHAQASLPDAGETARAFTQTVTSEAPPAVTAGGGMELLGLAKLNDGARLIMLLDVANLVKGEKFLEARKGNGAVKDDRKSEMQDSALERQGLGEVQLVTNPGIKGA
jgi:hypothetical protein